jgi:DNA-binding SARP family transcriptional activator
MYFNILGPLEVTDGERALALGGVKQRLLLAVLLLHANRVVTPDQLRAELWGESPPATASKSIQIYVSRHRKELGPDRLLTRGPGYVLRVADDELDAGVFERLLAEARSTEPGRDASKLREALALWKGPALADLAYESAVQAEIQRLEELRLTAGEDRFEADLAAGRNAELIGELEALIVKHPLRERLRRQLMLALYRASRHAEALQVYRAARRDLVELGLEPSRELRDLEQAILRQDPSLDLDEPPVPVAPAERTIVAVPREPASAAAVLALAAPLSATAPLRALIVACVVAPEAIGPASSALAQAADGNARTAAFSSPTPGADLARMASEHGADLLVIEAGSAPLDAAGAALRDAPCDVALMVGGPPRAGPVCVPFGGMHHDWAALELGAWIARATGAPLRLMGATADGRADKRDASRLLADASLIVQRQAGVTAEPLLARPGREGVTELAGEAGVLVVGLSDRWSVEGLGRVRSRLAAAPPAPTLFVRRASTASERQGTRFGWSLTGVR